MTLYSEIWSETKKPGTMMSTQTFLGDDNTGSTHCFANISSTIIKIKEYGKLCHIKMFYFDSRTMDVQVS